jgi:sugar-specific transcriptional regulator TrmB
VGTCPVPSAPRRRLFLPFGFFSTALGSSSTGAIAKKSHVSRSKLYIILDKLEKKGLVSHVEKNGVNHFQATEPCMIRDNLKEKEMKLAKLRDDFEGLLPELELIQKQAGKIQKVRVYQGLKGLTTAHEHTYLKLKKSETYYYLGIPKEQPLSHHLYWQRDHKRRSKAGIKCQLLFNKDTKKATLKNRNSYSGCDARFMPTNIKTPAYFLIYKDTVMMAIPVVNPLAVEIESKEIAKSFMAYFQEFWKNSKAFQP